MVLRQESRIRVQVISQQEQELQDHLGQNRHHPRQQRQGLGEIRSQPATQGYRLDSARYALPPEAPVMVLIQIILIKIGRTMAFSMRLYQLLRFEQRISLASQKSIMKSGNISLRTATLVAIQQKMINENNTRSTQHRFVSLLSQCKDQSKSLLSRKPKHSYNNINWYMNANLNSNINLPGMEYEHYSKIKKATNIRSISRRKKHHGSSSTGLAIEPTTPPSVLKSRMAILLPPLRLGQTEVLHRNFADETHLSKQSTPPRTRSPFRFRENRMKEVKRMRVGKKLRTEPAYMGGGKELGGWENGDQDEKFFELIEEEQF